jgi:hypothetical protein
MLVDLFLAFSAISSLQLFYLSLNSFDDPKNLLPFYEPKVTEEQDER